MVSIWGLAERLTADVFLQWCEAVFSVGVEKEKIAKFHGRDLAGAIKTLYANLPQAGRDTLQADFHRVARVSDPRLALAFWAGVGADQKLINDLEALASPEDRALWLLANKPDVFDRTEIVTAFADHGQRRWRGYHLEKGFSRSWTPDENAVGNLTAIASRVVLEIEQAARRVEVEPFEARGATGGLSYYFIIHVPDRSERSGEWVDLTRVTRVRTPDRRIDLVISPQAKTLEIVGGGGIGVGLVERLADVFAAEALGQKKTLTQFQRRKFFLGGLRKRPTFPSNQEHGIKSVTVTKLVIGSGAGTITYWSPVRRSVDVYDVLAAGPGRSIAGRTVIAASIRIVFDPLPGAKRERRLLLEITMPNSSSLREEQPLDQIIIETYLREWGLLDPVESERGDNEALDQLVGLLRAPPSAALSSDEAESQFGSRRKWLESSKILERIATPIGLMCFECTPPHPVGAQEDAVGTLPKFVCPIAGDITRSDPSPEFWSVNRCELAAALRDALKADVSIFREVRQGQLWCLGVVPSPRAWTAFFAPDLTDKDVFQGVLEALEGPLGKEPGLLITATELPLELRLPNGHRLTPIPHILRLTPQGFIPLPGIARALQGKAPARKRGPKDRKAEAIELLQSRKRHGLSRATPYAETKKVMSELIARNPAGIPDFKEVRYVWFKEQFE